MQPTTAPGWVQILIGLGLGAIAVSALRVDIINNYQYGATISPEMATVMVIAAVCVGALPAIAALFRWDALLIALTVMALTMTCWSAVNAYANKMGVEILSKTSQADRYAAAKEDQARLRAVLGKIKETADAPTLARLVADAKTAAEASERSDTAKMGIASCFKPCREAKANHMALLDRLAEARARDNAKAELAKAETEAKVGPAEASMAATWIASRSGHDANDIARTIALVLTVLGIIVTQGVALLAHMAAKMIATGIRTSRGITLREAPAATMPARSSPQPPHGYALRNEAEVLEWIQRKMRASQGRVYRCPSRRELSRELSMPHSTLCSWIARWSEQGRIVVKQNGRITEFSFPVVRRVA